MSLNLPEASYEYLKKLAKDRLAFIRERQPTAKLADAQLAIAREYGFSSWRALKVEMDLRRAPQVALCVHACAAGDLLAAGLADAERSLQTARPDSSR